MAKLRIPLLFVIVLAVATAFYLLFSTPDYGDINADGLKLGKAAYQQGDYDDAVKWFRLAAKKGDKQAQYLFAMLYRDGDGVNRDAEQAVSWLKLAAAQNHLEAQYQLANMLEYGRGLPVVDLPAALMWYKKAAAAGHKAAQLRMAVLLTEGRGVAKNDIQALEWAIKAASSNGMYAKAYLQRLLNGMTAKAASGDAAAQFVLARMYQQGKGLHVDAEKAEQWLLQSARRGNAKAQYHLAALFMHRSRQRQDDSVQEDYDLIADAADWYLKAARQGDMRAAAKVGVLYALGHGLTGDKGQATLWLKKAAESGLPSAQANLAILYVEAGKDDLGLTWLRKAAKQGDSIGQNNLAVMYALGRGVQVNMANMTLAVKWFKKAAENNDGKAQYNLALMFLRGVGLIQDEDAALIWLKKAQKAERTEAIAEQSASVQAKLVLGLLYDLGEGVVPNEMDAESWYQQALHLGSADALYNLASLYYRHLKFKQAFDLFMQAAKQGDAEAQSVLASMYQQGQGNAADIRQSVYWYEQAAKGGYAPAQFNLANLYRKGEGMEQQDKQAVHWYRKAAKQGFAPAQNALAYMYALGRGVALNRAQAHAWFGKASEHGLSIAGQNMILLKQKKSGFTLTSQAVDVQLRAAIVHEHAGDLVRHLLLYHTPQLRLAP